MKSVKKSVLLAFEEEDFIEFRKILFKKGISVQEFFAHVMYRCIMQDDSVETFYKETLKNKKEIMEKGGDLKNIKIDNVESMYEAIEQGLKKRK